MHKYLFPAKISIYELTILQTLIEFLANNKFNDS